VKTKKQGGYLLEDQNSERGAKKSSLRKARGIGPTEGRGVTWSDSAGGDGDRKMPKKEKCTGEFRQGMGRYAVYKSRKWGEGRQKITKLLKQNPPGYGKRGEKYRIMQKRRYRRRKEKKREIEGLRFGEAYKKRTANRYTKSQRCKLVKVS